MERNFELNTMERALQEIVEENTRYNYENFRSIESESTRFHRDLVDQLSELDNRIPVDSDDDFAAQAQELSIIKSANKKFSELFPERQFTYDGDNDPSIFTESFKEISREMSNVLSTLGPEREAERFLDQTNLGNVANELLQNNYFHVLDIYMIRLWSVDFSGPLRQSMHELRPESNGGENSIDIVGDQWGLGEGVNPRFAEMFSYNFPEGYIGNMDRELMDLISDRFVDVINFSHLNTQYGLMFTGACDSDMSVYECLDLNNFIEVSTSIGDPLVFLQVLNMLHMLNRTLRNRPSSFMGCYSECFFFLKICSEAHPDKYMSEILNDLLLKMSTTHRGIRTGDFLYYYMSITRPRYVDKWRK